MVEQRGSRADQLRAVELEAQEEIRIVVRPVGEPLVGAADGAEQRTLDEERVVRARLERRRGNGGVEFVERREVQPLRVEPEVPRHEARRRPVPAGRRLGAGEREDAARTEQRDDPLPPAPREGHVVVGEEQPRAGGERRGGVDGAGVAEVDRVVGRGDGDPGGAEQRGGAADRIARGVAAAVAVDADLEARRVGLAGEGPRAAEQMLRRAVRGENDADRRVALHGVVALAQNPIAAPSLRDSEAPDRTPVARSRQTA